MAIDRFNIRVYGILLNEQDEVLLVHERIGEMAFTKFPGGGLEFGEGIKDCLKREYKEETGLDVEVGQHLYTTDFFQQSAFRQADQLIAVYYRVTAPDTLSLRLDEHEVLNEGRTEHFRFAWVRLDELDETMLTFPVDKLVCRMILS